MSKKKKKKYNQTEDEILNPYSTDKISHIKPGVKIGFLRFWIAGAAFLLSFMTPAFVSEDLSTEIVVFFLVFVLMSEFIGNKIIIWMNNSNQPTLKYLPFWYTNPKSAKGLWLTFLYCLIMVPAILAASFGINSLLIYFNLWTPGFILGGEGAHGRLDPFTVGLMYVLVNAIYLRIKWYFGRMYENRYHRLVDKILAIQIKAKLLEKKLEITYSQKSKDHIAKKLESYDQKIKGYYDNPCNVKRPYKLVNKKIDKYEKKLENLSLRIKQNNPKDKRNKLLNRQTTFKIRQRNYLEQRRNLDKEVEEKQAFVIEKTTFIPHDQTPVIN